MMTALNRPVVRDTGVFLLTKGASLTVYAATDSPVRTLALAVIDHALQDVEYWTTWCHSDNAIIDPHDAIEFLCSPEGRELAMGCGATMADWQWVLLRNIGFQGEGFACG